MTAILTHDHIFEQLGHPRRFAVLIDGSNTFSALKSLDIEIDYKLLYKALAQRGTLLRVSYYTTLLEEPENNIRPLIDFLDYNGYYVVTKFARDYSDKAGTRRIKGSMDVEISVDALELAPHIDSLVLFTGDNDFRYLVEALQRKGVRVAIISTIETSPPIAADELRRQADVFIDLAMMREWISRKS